MPPKPHFLVTAGSTREKIDRVRDWGNIFTGQTGLDIARALLDLGNVTLLTSNQTHAREFDGFSGKAGMLGIETFQTHADLKSLLEERLTGESAPVHGVFMTAAVSDYTPAGVFRIVERQPAAAGCETWIVENVQAEKVKSHYGLIAVLGQATEKLVDLFRTTWGYQGLLVKFKLEVGITEDELIKVASASRLASRADFIVANTLEMAARTPSSVPPLIPPGAYLIGENLCERIPRDQLAPRLRTLAAHARG